MRNKLFLVLLILLLPVMSFAHDIQSLDYTVYLTPEGHGEVTVLWTSNQSSDGTENYIPITNIGDSEIINFSVSEKGVPYTENPDWDSDLSRDEKTNTYGMADISDGVELIWGMGAEGPHQYELKYTITNLVKNYNDSQALFWQFINYDLSDPPERVRLRVYGDEPITDDIANVWAFGYTGTVHFVNGEVIAESTEGFNRRNYLTLLLEFPNRPFATVGRVGEDFEDTKARAFEGSDYETTESGQAYGVSGSRSRSSRGFSFLFFLPMILPILGFFGIATYIKNYDGIATRAYKRKYKGEYVKQDPVGDNIEDSFYALNRMGITGMNELIAAWMLKWLKEGRLEEVAYEEKGILKSENIVMRVPERATTPEGYEGRYFDFVRHAAGEDGTLTEKELNAYLSKKTKSVKMWEKEFFEYSRQQAIHYGLYTQDGKKKPVITDRGRAFEQEVHQYYNYLYDFSEYNEGNLFEESWDDVMVTAMLLNVGERLNEQYERQDPAYRHRTYYRPYYIGWSTRTARNNVKSYNPVSSSSSSSGGGGFSSSGGGGGSFGGGGGGGSR